MTGTRLKDLGRWQSGGTPPKDQPELWRGETPWISAKDIADTELREPVSFISRDAAERYSTVAPAGSLLVIVRGMALVHGLPVVQCSTPVAFNQDLRSLVCGPQVFPRFAYYSLIGHRAALARHIDRAAHGTARVSDSIMVERVPVPSLSDQRRISSFLDRECARIATLVAHLSGLRASATTVAAQEFERRALAHSWPPVPLKYSLQQIEQGWSPDCDNHLADEGSWGVLKVGCVNYGRFRPEEHKALPPTLTPRPSLQVSKGDFLVSRANTRSLVGSAAVVRESPIWKLILCDKLYRLALDEEKLLAPFAAYAINSPSARAQLELATSGASSSMQNISQAVVRNLRLSRPPIEDQADAIRQLDEATDRARILQDELTTFILRLTEYKVALITEAVCGRLGRLRTEVEACERAAAALEGRLDEVA